MYLRNAQCLQSFLIVVAILTVSMTAQASADDTSESEKQASEQESSKDLTCEKGSQRVWMHDGSPACVKPENILSRAELGFLHPLTIDRISISDKRDHEVSENTYAFQFDYCAAIFNKDVLGVIVSSDTEKVPLPIDSNIQIGQCHQYGTQIRASSNLSINVSLFHQKDMGELIQTFDAKKGNLEEDLIHLQQKLLRLENPDLDEDNVDEINQLKTRMELVVDVIQSYDEGLRTLRTMR